MDAGKRTFQEDRRYLKVSWTEEGRASAPQAIDSEKVQEVKAEIAADWVLRTTASGTKGERAGRKWKKGCRDDLT